MPAKPVINLEKKPQLAEIHACCDYVELLCVVSQDNEISRADIIDRFRESLDIDTSPILEIDEDGDHEDLLEDASPSEEDDKYERMLADWFNHLQYRQGAFGDFYPFIISADGDVLKLKEEITSQHKFYVFLLLASNIKYVRSFKSNLTTCFEEASKKALEKCLPSTAEVHIFGTSAGKVGRYPGNKWQKIQQLSQDIRVKLNITEDKYSPYDTGDGGLDIVAWVPFQDTATGLIIIFGQCACTDEWVTKQHSSSYEAWNSVLSLVNRPYNVVFIPFFFRDSLGNWWKPQDIHQTVVMDRLRLSTLLYDDYQFIEDHQVMKNIDAALSFEESIV